MVFDKSLLTPCPVLRPSIEEFENPIGYLSRKDNTALGAEYGIVRVVPPPGWRPPFSISPSFKFHTRLQRLSDLGLTNRSRKFFRDNLNRFLKMKGKRQSKLHFNVNIPEEHKKIKVYLYDLHCAVEKFGGAEALDEEKWEQLNDKFGIARKSPEIRRKYDEILRAYALFLNQKESSCDFPETDSETEQDSCLVCGKSDRPSQTLLCDNCDTPFHIGCLEPALDSIPSGRWYCDKCLIGTGEYGFEEETEIMYTLGEFNNLCNEFNEEFKETYNEGKPLTVDMIEQKFWEFVDIEKSDLEVKYGADIHKSNPGEISGFPMYSTPHIPKDDPSVRSYIEHPCNLTNLPYAKGSLLNYINSSISGMTIPWIYIGSLLSTFCWHVEDHYTLSANYCHMGATKKWYAIPSSDADKFEKLMKSSAPDLFKKQPDLLHQLVTLLSPMTLVKNRIKCVYADQLPNEFVVTYPRVYHAGFNCGFNFNEAVNFTTPEWLDVGEKSVVDYKAIKKENVFSHYELVENILASFVDRAAAGRPSSDLALIKRCIVSLEKFVDHQNHLLEKLDRTQLEATERLPDPATHDEDIGLCDLCKSSLAFSYCKINNESRDFGTHHSVAVKKEPSDSAARISIHQLITPEASPQSLDPRSGDTAPAGSDPRSVAALESSRQLVLATAPGNTSASDATAKLSMMAAYDNLIREAKRQAASEPEPPARRKSRRLQEHSHPPREGKMSLVQRSATHRSLNEKPVLSLCLGCVLAVYRPAAAHIPRGSQLVATRAPSALPRLLARAKHIYLDIA